MIDLNDPSIPAEILAVGGCRDGERLPFHRKEYIKVLKKPDPLRFSLEMRPSDDFRALETETYRLVRMNTNWRRFWIYLSEKATEDEAVEWFRRGPMRHSFNEFQKIKQQENDTMKLGTFQTSGTHANYSGIFKQDRIRSVEGGTFGYAPSANSNNHDSMHPFVTVEADDDFTVKVKIEGWNSPDDLKATAAMLQELARKLDEAKST